VKTRAHFTLVNELETSAIDIADRGLAYGDGLFETLRVCDGAVPLLAYHLERLKRGVGVLRLGDPDIIAGQFERYVSLALKDLTKSAHLKRALIKIIVTRGQGGRGYTPPDEPAVTFITQVFEYPLYPESNYLNGISLYQCQHRLSDQPALAGIKHLNRLDQVLGSQELEASGCEEGLMLDQQGKVIEGTKSNLLIFDGQKVTTPRLAQAGVAGTLRQYLLENADEMGFALSEADVSIAQLKSADGLAVINSVFGLWPVKEFAGKRYAASKICGMIQSHLKTDLSF
jgi:4-amino-4-deoxychorismate lyase